MARFNGAARDELPNAELFDTLLEAKVLTERRRRAYNTVRPHSALGYRPPAPEARPVGPPGPTTLGGGPERLRWLHPWGQITVCPEMK